MNKIPNLRKGIVAVAAVATIALAGTESLQAAEEEAPAPTAATKTSDNPVVLMKTSQGNIRIELWPDAAPETVKNFIDLAEGNKTFKDAKTGEDVKKPFYDGLTFHRVIKDFMIQGGCPLGTGTGDPGYKFKDEINAKGLGLADLKAMGEGGAPHPWLLIRDQASFQRTVLGPVLQKLGISSQEQFQEKLEEIQNTVNALSVLDVYANLGYAFDDKLPAKKPDRGVIAMANSGPNTNGSQFFINVVDTPHLTGKHTVFGKVIEGMDIADKISNLETDPSGKTTTPVTIESIRVEKK
jgi:cyclophilin family peptidyl-prolyl cis-trans isomerase